MGQVLGLVVTSTKDRSGGYELTASIFAGLAPVASTPELRLAREWRFWRKRRDVFTASPLGVHSARSFPPIDPQALLALALTMPIIMPTAPAAACRCLPSAYVEVLPEPFAVDVPTHVSPWVIGSAPEWELISLDGVPVEV